MPNGDRQNIIVINNVSLLAANNSNGDPTIEHDLETYHPDVQAQPTLFEYRTDTGLPVPGFRVLEEVLIECNKSII